MSANLVKIIGCIIGFGVLFWALFFFGHLADRTIEENEKAESEKKTAGAGGEAARK